jgi:tRNA threonylcarbamoyladenosine biosynthesis protein TsaE
MKESKIAYNLEDTKKIAEELAQEMEPGGVVCLNGELGAGKTAFAGFFIRALGADCSYVPSPTFAIVNEYETTRFPVYHFDFYRLESPEDIYANGFDELLFGNGVCIAEWAEKMEPALPKKRIEIEIRKNFCFGSDFREFLIERKGEPN